MQLIMIQSCYLYILYTKKVADSMQQTSLFQQDVQEPLASRLRPQTLEDYVGQKHLINY